MAFLLIGINPKFIKAGIDILELYCGVFDFHCNTKYYNPFLSAKQKDICLSLSSLNGIVNWLFVFYYGKKSGNCTKVIHNCITFH
jgi:hypothetical protein